MLKTEKHLQYWLYQILAKIEYNPEYSAKQIKKDIAGILGEVNGLSCDDVLVAVKEEVENFNEQQTN
jgi:hypothetical protein